MLTQKLPVKKVAVTAKECRSPMEFLRFPYLEKKWCCQKGVGMLLGVNVQSIQSQINPLYPTVNILSIFFVYIKRIVCSHTKILVFTCVLQEKIVFTNLFANTSFGVWPGPFHVAGWCGYEYRGARSCFRRHGFPPCTSWKPHRSFPLVPGVAHYRHQALMDTRVCHPLHAKKLSENQSTHWGMGAFAL